MTSPQLDRGPQLLPTRHGWLGVAIGVIMLIVGIAVIARPGPTLLIVAVLFGLELIALGLGRIFLAIIGSAAPRWWRGVVAGLGVVTVLAGIICLVRPGTSLFVVAILVAAAWLVDGVSQIISGLTVYRSSGQRISQVALGALSVIAAIVVMVWPAQSLVLMTTVGGTILIILGVITVITAGQALLLKSRD